MSFASPSPICSSASSNSGGAIPDADSIYCDCACECDFDTEEEEEEVEESVCEPDAVGVVFEDKDATEVGDMSVRDEGVGGGRTGNGGIRSQLVGVDARDGRAEDDADDGVMPDADEADAAEMESLRVLPSWPDISMVCSVWLDGETRFAEDKDMDRDTGCCCECCDCD